MTRFLSLLLASMLLPAAALRAAEDPDDAAIKNKWGASPVCVAVLTGDQYACLRKPAPPHYWDYLLHNGKGVMKDGEEVTPANWNASHGQIYSPLYEYMSKNADAALQNAEKTRAALESALQEARGSKDSSARNKIVTEAMASAKPDIAEVDKALGDKYSAPLRKLRTELGQVRNEAGIEKGAQRSKDIQEQGSLKGAKEAAKVKDASKGLRKMFEGNTRDSNSQGKGKDEPGGVEAEMKNLFGGGQLRDNSSAEKDFGKPVKEPPALAKEEKKDGLPLGAAAAAGTAAAGSLGVGAYLWQKSKEAGAAALDGTGKVIDVAMGVGTARAGEFPTEAEKDETAGKARRDAAQNFAKTGLMDQSAQSNLQTALKAQPNNEARTQKLSDFNSLSSKDQQKFVKALKDGNGWDEAYAAASTNQ